jgi:hypothetical protein
VVSIGGEVRHRWACAAIGSRPPIAVPATPLSSVSVWSVPGSAPVAAIGEATAGPIAHGACRVQPATLLKSA